ncbi:MAG: SCO family protein [Paracoccaceae bacterium]
MNKAYAYTAGGLVLAMLGGLATFVFMSTREDQFASCSESTVAGGAAIGGPFELVDETGRTVTDRDVIDRPSLIYFGYTYCPDVCPVDISRNAEAVELLEEQGYDVKPIFISIDPERDTPEILAEFTDILHPDMLGLTGSPEQVKVASQAYKTFYRKNEGAPDEYLVDHSTFTYLVAPETGFLEFFRNDISAEKMASTVACFMDQM